jgi:hypothetical protein
MVGMDDVCKTRYPSNSILKGLEEINP